MSEFAGLLRHRIEIWERSGERTAAGLASEEWTIVARCLARIEAEGAGAISEAMALSALPKFRVTIRANQAVAVDHRVHWGNRRLIIRHVLFDPSQSDRLVLRCEELRELA